MNYSRSIKNFIANLFSELYTCTKLILLFILPFKFTKASHLLSLDYSIIQKKKKKKIILLINYVHKTLLSYQQINLAMNQISVA